MEYLKRYIEIGGRDVLCQILTPWKGKNKDVPIYILCNPIEECRYKTPFIARNKNGAWCDVDMWEINDILIYLNSYGITPIDLSINASLVRDHL